MEKLNCAQAKQIDLVDYLASLGYQPQKIRSQDYWYLSPLRTEQTPSFKVDRRRNLWYDHGTGKGGDLIDFGTLYFQCSISELLQRLLLPTANSFSFHQQSPITVEQISAGEKKGAPPENRVVILDKRPITSPLLLSYLDQRHISLAAAQPYCREVDFLLYGKLYTAIGFKNNVGGYELRNANFKGSSAPKDITFIDAGVTHVSVFEGFFNFLSFQTAGYQQGQQPLTNFLVLNSLSFFERSKQLMEKHTQVNLYLDRDQAGLQCTQQALQWDKIRYTDRSSLYKGYKDLNEWLVKKQNMVLVKRIKRKLGRHF